MAYRDTYATRCRSSDGRCCGWEMWPQSAFVWMRDWRRVQVQHGHFILTAYVCFGWKYVVVSTAAYTHRLPACLSTTNMIFNKTKQQLWRSYGKVRRGTLSLLLVPPTGLPSLPYRVYPITTQMNCSCPFLSCRFKNFSPETLVTFWLRLFSHQITLYAFTTFLCLA